MTTKTFALSSLACLFIWLNGCEIAMAHSAEKFPRVIDLQHPILLVTSEQTNTQSKWTPEIFRQLNHYEPFIKTDWQKRFGASETKAVQQFCNYARRKSAERIESIIGNPELEGYQQIPNSYAHYLIRVFSMGGSRIPVRLTFRDGICTQAKISSTTSDICAQKNFLNDTFRIHPILGVCSYHSLGNRNLDDRTY